MRKVLDLFRRRAAGGRPPNGGWYRSESCRPLTVGQVRERNFRTVRRGLDPVEVHAFLHRVAGDLALARREVARTAEENVRIKRALRNWQSRFTPGARGFARSICRTLGFLADVERGGTTVSREDEQSVRHWVWCDRVLDGGRRCPLPADHDGACGPLRRR